MDHFDSDFATPVRNISRNAFGVRAPVPRDRFRRVPPSPKTPADWAHSTPLRNQSAKRSPAAFTLIELLVVIAVISILAALIIPIGKAVNRKKIISKARGELAQVETAIESYKETLGHYPPDNHLPPNQVIPWRNQLYFELKGTTNTGSTYLTLDGSAQVPADVPTLSVYFAGVSGFINCTLPGGSDEGRRAKSFLSDLKPGQVGDVSQAPADHVKVLTSSVPWPRNDWGPNNMNPIRYNSSSPTNNPNSFDLWIDVVIDGKTNRISNWSQEPLVVSSPY